ncbi:glycosyltransferase family 2 protein [Geobacillus sp. DSP4a]|uniref:glycosyltransferase family 2 protein n=1 Tax=Geobacillus sp. DSP4a TaxID=2508873 RepID=UPI00149297BB|nr:glycosyltransferase family 2 protein [Geobacillus sp. DSP4a]NNU98275.1 glycosyltransferase family 2 protein [Geobacillus sp. DSP4a]
MMEKELVSILLATYNPKIEYLRKQLESINKQDYPNIELIICDDFSKEEIYHSIIQLVEETVTRVPYKIIRNKKNLGSNKTFELLTKIGSGDFYAYCDQDDIWEEHKISSLVRKIKSEEALICYSDLSVINENDIIISKSFKRFSKRIQHVFGEKKYGYFLRRNSISGCAMLIRSDVAKESLPFPEYKYYVHDHWLTLFASCKGKIAYIEEPLVRYRIHSNNQIGAKIMQGIYNKEDYIYNKLYLEREKLAYAQKRLTSFQNEHLQKEILKIQKFIENRIEFFEKLSVKSMWKLIKNINYDPLLVIFEILFRLLPDRFSGAILSFAKR